MRPLLALALLLTALPARADGLPEVDLYAYCDGAPRVDDPAPRLLSLSVTRRASTLALLAVQVRAAGSRDLLRPTREDRSGLPAELRLHFPATLCRGSLDVQVTVRDALTGATRTVTSRVLVQRVQ